VVEAISGRSSNMQRHIRTCDNITPDERSRVMANFEASQAASRSSKEPEAGDSKLPRFTGQPPWSPSTQYGFQTGLSSRPRATSTSDDDGTSSSSFPSPDLARCEFVRPERGPDGSPPRPSPKLSLQSILNDDMDPYSSSRRGYAARSPPSGTTSSFDRRPIPSPELSAEYRLVTQLDHDIEEFQRVQTRLENQSSSRQVNYSSDETVTLESMRRKLDELHQEHARLRQRVSSTKNDDGDLRVRLERTGETLRRVESAERGGRRFLLGGSGGSGGFRMEIPRANTTPTLTHLAESETLKRRKIGDGRSNTAGFVSINGV
jgi:hypothetical protein